MASCFKWLFHSSRRWDRSSITFNRAPLFQKIEAEYEALIIDLIYADGNCGFCVQGDLKLIIKQVNGDFVLKEIAFLSYRTFIQKLTKFLRYSI